MKVLSSLFGRKDRETASNEATMQKFQALARIDIALRKETDFMTEKMDLVAGTTESGRKIPLCERIIREACGNNSKLLMDVILYLSSYPHVILPPMDEKLLHNKDMQGYRMMEVILHDRSSVLRDAALNILASVEPNNTRVLAWEFRKKYIDVIQPLPHSQQGLGNTDGSGESEAK